MQLGRGFLMAAALLALGASSTACKTQTAASSAPDQLSFTLKDLSGKPVGTSDYSGRVVLVDFWATWCKPCESSFPFYSQLQKDLGGEGLTILAISVDEKDSDVAAFLERRPVSFQILRDPEGTVAKTIDRAIETMPTAVLIGRDGRVRMVHAGFVTGDEAKLTQAVREALAATSTSSVSAE